MYRPAAFDVTDPQPLLSDLVATTVATLVLPGPDGLTSTLLPLLYDPAGGTQGSLVGHVARGNPLVAAAEAAGDRPLDVLVVVTGPEGYVSPSWYASKAAHGKVVPTWNYVTVEAGGPLVVHREPDWLLDVVSRLTDRHEHDRPTPWAVTDAPETFVAGQLRGIVGIEVPITRLAAKAKLSQNRPAPDRAGVVTGLRTEGTTALADAVESADPAAGGS